MKNSSHKPGLKVNIIKVYRSGDRKSMADTIPSELLLQVFLNGKKVSTISCLPRDLSLLAVGFIVNHGYVKDFSSINLVSECGHEKEQELLWARADVGAEMKEKEAFAPIDPVFLPSGCGNIDDFILKKKIHKIDQGQEVPPSILLGLNIKALEAQQLKKQFGGLHSASLFDFKGRLLFSCEDIGRHNCIDKVAGYIYINHISPEGKIMFTTGRLSLDAIYKLNKMRIPVSVTNSSVTYSAAKLAGRANMTLVGYARGGRFNIYSGQERIGK